MEKFNVIVLMAAVAIIVILLFVIFRMFNRGKLREKFHQAVSSGNYHDLVYFLILSLKDDSIRKKILKKSYYHYDDYLRRGLNKYFDERLNVRVTSSRTSRIQEFFEVAKHAFSESESKIGVSSNFFWKPIEGELKKIISICGPKYFYRCYVNSLLNSEKEEEATRSFILDYYNQCANSKNEDERAQFYSFVELVNKEIDQDQEYLIMPKEKKDFLLTKKLKIEENISTVKNIYARA